MTTEVKIPKIEIPEKIDWDKVFDQLVGFSAWQAHWNKIREAQVKKNHESN